MSTGQQGQSPGQLTPAGVGWGHKPGPSLGWLWDGGKTGLLWHLCCISTPSAQSCCPRCSCWEQSPGNTRPTSPRLSIGRRPPNTLCDMLPLRLHPARREKPGVHRGRVWGPRDEQRQEAATSSRLEGQEWGQWDLNPGITQETQRVTLGLSGRNRSPCRRHPQRWEWVGETLASPFLPAWILWLWTTYAHMEFILRLKFAHIGVILKIQSFKSVQGPW